MKPIPILPVRLNVALVVLLATAACGSSPAETCAESAQAITGGSQDPSTVGLDDGVAATAVGAIVTETDGAAPELCSGVLVAPRLLLSAAHCARGAPASAVHVVFGPLAPPFATGGECAAPVATFPAVALVRHPTADAMLVELASSPPATPVPIAVASPALGQAAVIAGYGLSTQGTAGELLFLATTVVAVEAGLITVDSGADGGACLGDSGGPLFARGGSDWQVAGVLSEGSAYCTGQDIFVEAAAIASWMQTTFE